MTVQLNVSYYGSKQDPSNINTLIDTHICPIYLYNWTLNDLAYCHNKIHLTEQSFSVLGRAPCTMTSSTSLRMTAMTLLCGISSKSLDMKGLLYHPIQVGKAPGIMLW